jgi:hypothetical protein
VKFVVLRELAGLNFGLPEAWEADLELKRFIFLGNGSFSQLCGKKP